MVIICQFTYVDHCLLLISMVHSNHKKLLIIDGVLVQAYRLRIGLDAPLRGGERCCCCGSGAITIIKNINMKVRSNLVY